MQQIDGSEEATADLVQRAGHAMGSARLISQISARHAETEYRMQQLSRYETMRPAFLFRERARLRSLDTQADLLARCVEVAETLPSRTLAIFSEAEGTISLTGKRFSAASDDGAAVGFNDEVASLLLSELMAWWHIDPRFVTLKINEISEPNPDKWLLVIQAG